MDGHREVTGCVVFLRFHLEFGGEDLSDLGVQHRNGAGFGTRQFFLQGNRVFELPDLLQDPDNGRDRTRVANQLHKAFLDTGAAEELIEFMEQELPAA